MHMIRLLPGAALLLVSACAHQPPAPAPVQLLAAPCPPSESVPAEDPEALDSLASLLVYRQHICSESEAQQAELLAAARDQALPQANLVRLMLASCAPDKTPGLLANSVALARNESDPPPGFFALLDLLDAQLRSYALLERRLRETEQQLENMIEGIRSIEHEMGAEANGEGGEWAHGDNLE